VVKLVSAVGGGKLSRELDLEKIAIDLEATQVQYDPSNYHGIIARFSDSGPAILIYRSGSFSISGAKSLEELKKAFDKFEDKMQALLGELDYEVKFESRNLVHRAEVSTNEIATPLNLNMLVVGLEIENVEYEPEQFPGLMYRPPDLPGLYLVFSSGALVSTGHSDPDIALRGIEEVSNRIINLVNIIE
jgi:transcription initiation factor TFIID TATA-box-binding protein